MLIAARRKCLQRGQKYGFNRQGDVHCNMIVAVRQKINNKKPTLNFAVRIDVDQSYNPAKNDSFKSGIRSEARFVAPGS
jgi:hypothetical protein